MRHDVIRTVEVTETASLNDSKSSNSVLPTDSSFAMTAWS
jgi:hypothetical protein